MTDHPRRPASFRLEPQEPAEAPRKATSIQQRKPAAIKDTAVINAGSGRCIRSGHRPRLTNWTG